MAPCRPRGAGAPLLLLVLPVLPTPAAARAAAAEPAECRSTGGRCHQQEEGLEVEDLRMNLLQTHQPSKAPAAAALRDPCLPEGDMATWKESAALFKSVFYVQGEPKPSLRRNKAEARVKQPSKTPGLEALAPELRKRYPELAALHRRLLRNLGRAVARYNASRGQSGSGAGCGRGAAALVAEAEELRRAWWRHNSTELREVLGEKLPALGFRMEPEDGELYGEAATDLEELGAAIFEVPLLFARNELDLEQVLSELRRRIEAHPLGKPMGFVTKEADLEGLASLAQDVFAVSTSAASELSQSFDTILGLSDYFINNLVLTDVRDGKFEDVTPGNFAERYLTSNESEPNPGYLEEGPCRPLLDNGEAAMKEAAEYNRQHGWEAIRFKSSYPYEGRDVYLTGWWLPAASDFAIVVVHGRTRNANWLYTLLEASQLRLLGFNVLAVNLRNHGSSDVTNGNYSWSIAEVSDVVSAAQEASARAGVPLAHVGLDAGSLGGWSASTAFGYLQEVPGLWLDSPVYSPELGALGQAYHVLTQSGVWEVIATPLSRLISSLAPFVLWPYGYRPAVTPEAADWSGGSPAKRLHLTHYRGDVLVKFENSEKYREKALEEGVTLFEWYLEIPEYEQYPDTCGDSYRHMDAMMAGTERYRRRLCCFWSSVFGSVTAGCQAIATPESCAETLGSTF